MVTLKLPERMLLLRYQILTGCKDLMAKVEASPSSRKQRVSAGWEQVEIARGMLTSPQPLPGRGSAGS